MVTFKEIVNKFEVFANKHSQIKSFEWGRISEMTTKDEEFVKMFLQQKQARKEGVELIIPFEIYIMDLVKQDHSNSLDVISDTLLIAIDLVDNYFYSIEEEDFYISTKSTFDSFRGKFDDVTDGWIINCDVHIQVGTCEIPFDE